MATNFPTSLDSFTTHSSGQVITSADVNKVQDALLAVETKIGANGNALSTSGTWTPSALGFTAWTFDPIFMGTSALAVATTQVVVVGMNLAAGTVTNLHNYVVANAVSTTCLMALYTSSGTLLGSSANIIANTATTGLKTFPLSAAQVVTQGFYYVSWHVVGTSAVTIGRTAATASAQVNLSVAGTLFRTAQSGTAGSTSANSPLGTLSGLSAPWWAATS